MLSSEGEGKGVRHRGERLSKSPRRLGTQRPHYIAALGLVRDYLRRRFTHLKLRAHLLDLRSLLFLNLWRQVTGVRGRQRLR